MKKFLLSLFIISSLAYSETLFDNAWGLKQVSTKYFEIIYPNASSNTVKRLLTYADKEYERLGNLFGMKHIERLTLVVTPDVELINGMFSSMPYNSIILYDFLDNASLLPFDDYFYNLFLHELTHAISLNLRNDFWYFFRRVLGTYISPHEWQIPAWMSEGVTVSMESSDGDGRSNDPRSKALLAQHMLEEKFQRVDQVSPMRVYPKKANLHYIYGGLFNTYLQQKYGWEKYKKLWYNNNNLIIPYTFCFSFENIYGKSIENMWLEFSFQYRLTNVIKPEEKILAKGIISSLKSDGKNLYYSETKKKNIYKLFPEKGKKSILIDQSGDFSIDREKSLLYIKETTLLYKTYKSKTKIFDINKKRFLQQKFERISKVDSSNDRIIAIEAERHFTSLILLENGNKNIILKGNEYTFFDNPLLLEDKIFFILIESNRRSIAMLDENKNIFLYQFPENVWIDEIVKSNGKILFNFYLKDRISLSRLGILDYKANEIYLQKEDFFGGIQSPVEIGNDLYYLKRLTDYDEVASLKDYKNKINFDRIYVEKIKFELKETEKIDIVLNSKNYNPLPYLIPHYSIPLIIPYPVNENNYIPLTFFYTSTETPTFENSYSFQFNSIGDPFNYYSLKSWNFYWNNSSLPVDLSFGIGGSHYENTNEYNFSFLVSKNILFKSSKMILYPFLGIYNTFGENYMKNTIKGGTTLYYNQLYKTPKYSYSFTIGEEIGYQFENDTLYYQGNISYNSGILFLAVDYGLSGNDIYGVGTNASKWSNFKSLFDNSKLSKSFISFDSGLFLRLDIDGTIGLFPVYLNYLGFSPGYSIIFTEKEYEYAFYGEFFIGTILFYYLPFVPSIEIGYLPERDRWYYLFDLKLTY